MTWSQDEAEWVAEAYYADHLLRHAAAPAPREVRDQHWWAVQRVQDAAVDGTMPLHVLDAVFRAGAMDEAFLGVVAAGPLEILLTMHGDKYDAEVAVRCQTDEMWAEAAACVLVHRERWEEMPPALQRLVPEPEQSRSKAQKTRKRPSKRQR